jgi:hypothetical protein
MTLKTLKVLTGVVTACVIGIVICLGGSIYTAVKQHRAEVEPAPAQIPVPAGIPAPDTPKVPVPQSS